jgi:uncharacterized membrane protein
MNAGKPSDLEAQEERSQPPSDEKEGVGRGKVLQSIFSAAAYHGPIPPALEAETWNNLVDGAAERILRMAELQATHRHAFENRQLEQTHSLRLGEIENLRRELELNHILNEQALTLHAKYDDQRNDRIRMGQVFGLFLGLGALIVAAYLGVRGQPWVAALMGTGGLAGIIWASISGGKRQLERQKPGQTAPTQPDRRQA